MKLDKVNIAKYLKLRESFWWVFSASRDVGSIVAIICSSHSPRYGGM